MPVQRRLRDRLAGVFLIRRHPQPRDRHDEAAFSVHWHECSGRSRRGLVCFSLPLFLISDARVTHREVWRPMESSICSHKAASLFFLLKLTRADPSNVGLRRALAVSLSTVAGSSAAVAAKKHTAAGLTGRAIARRTSPIGSEMKAAEYGEE